MEKAEDKELHQVLQECQSVFADSIRKVTHMKAQIAGKQGSTPTFCKAQMGWMHYRVYWRRVETSWASRIYWKSLAWGIGHTHCRSADAVSRLPISSEECNQSESIDEAEVPQRQLVSNVQDDTSSHPRGFWTDGLVQNAMHRQQIKSEVSGRRQALRILAAAGLYSARTSCRSTLSCVRSDFEGIVQGALWCLQDEIIMPKLRSVTAQWQRHRGVATVLSGVHSDKHVIEGRRWAVESPR